MCAINILCVNLTAFHPDQVWQYYLLPEEEQRMPGRKNPMCNTFPRIASCDYWRWGSGGRQENINAICILGLNHINDKVNLNHFISAPHFIKITICR